jgi:adenylate kinase
VSRGPRIVLLGRQGAGKGTQAELLAKRYGINHLSTGQLFRDSADAGIPVGLEARKYMDRGELVPDDIVVKVVDERFSNPAEIERGFVLDGFPRTHPQAEDFERILAPAQLDIVIELDVPDDIVVERMLERGREDDTKDSIIRRLELYEQETAPLVDFYRQRGLLTVVDGSGPVEQINKRIVEAIDSRFQPVRSSAEQ